jgi:hypothetical protein
MPHKGMASPQDPPTHPPEGVARGRRRQGGPQVERGQLRVAQEGAALPGREEGEKAVGKGGSGMLEEIVAPQDGGRVP